jgi:hypothetical protein
MVLQIASRADDAAGARAIVAVKIRDTNTASTNMVDLLENGDVKYKVIGESGSSKGLQSLVYSVNPNKYLGRSKPLADPTLKGSSFANPTEECYFEIVAGAIGTDDPLAVDILVTISYTAVFIEPKELARS